MAITISRIVSTNNHSVMIKKNERKKAQRKEKICDQEASNRKQTDLPGEVNNIQKKKQKKKNNRKQDREEHRKDRTD